MSSSIPDPEDGLLPAGVTHGPFVLDPGRSAVQNSQVVSAGAPVVGRRPVVPHHHHLFGRLKVAHRPQVPFPTVLLAPLPVRAPDDPGPNPLHHEPRAPHRGRRRSGSSPRMSGRRRRRHQTRRPSQSRTRPRPGSRGRWSSSSVFSVRSASMEPGLGLLSLWEVGRLLDGRRGRDRRSRG